MSKLQAYGWTFLDQKDFNDQFVDQNIFRYKIFLGQNFYRPKICFGSQISQIFSYPKFSQTQIFFQINEELTMAPYTKNNRNF